jgi:Lon protease-like protein
MFPLGTVLFPHQSLSLHVFEPRYRTMMKDLLAGGREFGVVLIARGSDVGGGDTRFDIGTVARIVETAEADDGRWALATVGTRRIRVTEWLDEDPYPRALIADLPDTSLSRFDLHLFERAERAVRRSLALKAELLEPAAPFSTKLDDDPAVAAWQVAGIAPLGPLDRQVLLELPGPVDRLRRLAELVEDECTVLAHRLSEG